jgi:hypothetical protein
MLKIRRPVYAWGKRSALLIVLLALVSGTAAVVAACGVGGSDTSGAPRPPEVLSLEPSAPSVAGENELVLSWKSVPGIDRFVLCQTVPPRGTQCEQHEGATQAVVTVPGPTDDPKATGTWLKYLWLQACGERECSRPPTTAGTIVHRVVYGTEAWNFIVIVRRLTGSQVEVALANAARDGSQASTLILSTLSGSEVARCENIAPGEWCGPLQSTLLLNEVVAEQIFGGIGASVGFAVTPSTTAPEYTPSSGP